MPVKPTYPGVYIEEIPSGVRTITGVATSVAAFVDRFARGPLGTPVQLVGVADLERELGGLSATSEASYAIQQFFINGGGECWAVRVADTTSSTGPATAASATLRAQPSAGATVFTISAGRQANDASVADPGIWGNNLYVEIDYDTADPRKSFNLTVSEIIATNGRRATARSESHRGLVMAPSGPKNAIETLNAASSMIQLDKGAGFPANLPAATGTMGKEIAVGTEIPASPVALSINAGSGARTVSVTHGLGATSEDHAAFRPLLGGDPGGGQRCHHRRRARPDRGCRGPADRQGHDGQHPYRYQLLAGRGGAGFTGAEKLAITGAGARALGLDATPHVQQVQLAGNLGRRPRASPTCSASRRTRAASTRSRMSISSTSSRCRRPHCCRPTPCRRSTRPLRAIASGAGRFDRRHSAGRRFADRDADLDGGERQAAPPQCRDPLPAHGRQRDRWRRPRNIGSQRHVLTAARRAGD
ncbi:MAG: hypothetical protein R3D25_04630 [Geminicoccaceae bacterium]